MKSWRTSLAGILTGVLYLAFTYWQNGTVMPKDIELAVGLAFGGLLAKDANVSHAPQPMAQAETVESP